MKAVFIKYSRFWTIGGCLFCSIALFSFFNQNQNPQDIRDQQFKSVVLQWYKLFLTLESKDETAYPPISSQRLAHMGIAGYLAYQKMDQHGFSNEYFIHLLNGVYGKSLKMYYHNLDQSAFLKISNLEKSISSSINSDINSTYFNREVENIISSIPVNLQNNDILFNSSAYAEDTKLCKNHCFYSSDPVQPHWGRKHTLILNESDVMVSNPYLEKESFYKGLYEDALELYTISMNLSKEDKWVVDFWSDDVRGLTFSPTGRWVSILNQIVAKENIDSKELFYIYFKLGVGLNDAAIITWRNKYFFNLERPSDFINKNINNQWEPFHDNPKFPSYPSGHSVFGAAASKILENHFGTAYQMTDKSHQNRNEFSGKQRSFKSLNEMAIENAYSRMLMGVHYKQDCDAGLRLGYEIGEIINKANLDNLLCLQNELL